MGLLRHGKKLNNLVKRLRTPSLSSYQNLPAMTPYKTTKQLSFVYSGIFISYRIIQTIYSDFNRCIFHGQ